MERSHQRPASDRRADGRDLRRRGDTGARRTRAPPRRAPARRRRVGASPEALRGLSPGPEPRRGAIFPPARPGALPASRGGVAEPSRGKKKRGEARSATKEKPRRGRPALSARTCGRRRGPAGRGRRFAGANPVAASHASVRVFPERPVHCATSSPAPLYLRADCPRQPSADPLTSPAGVERWGGGREDGRNDAFGRWVADTYVVFTYYVCAGRGYNLTCAAPSRCRT
jgi:hypothetical protein